jgi:hypothetical protein
VKIGCFITMTNPIERGDTYKECLSMAEDLFDEVTIIDGEETWPKEFNWPIIGEHFQRGYEECEADFVVHLDCDFLFHQKDFGKIRQALRDYPRSPAISFYKHQFIQPHKFNLKSRLLLAVNKKMYGDRVTFSGNGDLCQPQLDGRDLDLAEMPQAGVPFWNYDKLCKTKAQIMDDQGRMERAYKRHFGHYQLAKDDSDESAYEGWLHMQLGRYNKPQESVRLEQHPKYIIETIRNLKPEQFGYNGFGLFKGGYHS